MTKRIFRSICIVALTVLVVTSALLFYLLYTNLTETQFKQLEMQTETAAQGITLLGDSYFEGLDTAEYRVTWIGKDGSVLFDSYSDSASMENHMEREEIAAAFQNGRGTSARYSSTIMQRSLYYALRLEDGTVVRLSVLQSTVWTLLLDVTPSIVIVLLLTLLLSVILAIRLSRSIVGPLNRLNLDEPLENDGYDEISPLLCRLDSQQKELKQQAVDLQKKKDELDTVIDSMNEGIVLLNAQNHIISINSAAKKLLWTGDDCKGQDILTVCRHMALQEILSIAAKGSRAEKIVEFPSGCYLIDVGPIISAEQINGYAILFFDVTEKRHAEAMRREFTANVSHELKTPLHVIAGYAELMAGGMIKDRDVQDCASKIHTESKRMTHLIDDIINLSHLDEGASNMQRMDCDLLSLARSVLQGLEPIARKANVHLELQGAPVVVSGIPQLLQGILFNLCDNAVKYNRDGGRVTVEIRENMHTAFIKVSDTGIGIPTEHQSRIFERFYRVDKSHSKEVGGTGLGLSIVKHAAMIHEATIDLESTPDVGTAITVKIPK